MEFIITREDSELELQHHGTKGMRWGVRRYQNPDGSLTAAGKKRRSLGQTIHDYKVKRKRTKALEKARAAKEANKKAAEEEKVKAEKRAKDLAKGKISAKKMTDAELAESLKRKENEKKYQDAVLATSTGKRFISKTWNEAVVPGLVEGGKKAISSFVEKKLSDVLGLNQKDAKSALELAKEAADMAKYKKNRFEDERSLEEQKKIYKRYKESGTEETLEEFAKREKTAREQINKERKQQKDNPASGWYSKKGKDVTDSKTSTDSTERFDATGNDLVGEGTSSSKYKKDHGFIGSSKKSADYYDPIDTEGEWVNERSNTQVTTLPAVQKNSGKSFVAGLLEQKD